MFGFTSPPTTTRQSARPAFDLLDREADQAVVDQDVVPGLEHLGDRRGSDDEVAPAGVPGTRDVHGGVRREHARAVELGDPELRALQVCDQRERPPELGLNGTDPLGAGSVLVVRAVREVEADGVHAGRGERVQHLV